MTSDQPPTPAPPPARRQRSDAARNRDKILAAARAAFADPGLDPATDVSMAEVARRAGVGMATLYRNFPGRRELLEALYADEVDAVCEAARTLGADHETDAGGASPGDALATWLQRFLAYFIAKRPIAAELLAHCESSSDPVFDTNRTRVLAAARPLLAAAQTSHEVRDDLTLEQVLDMVIAIAKIPGGPTYLEPILQTALDGLRPGRGRRRSD